MVETRYAEHSDNISQDGDGQGGRAPADPEDCQARQVQDDQGEDSKPIDFFFCALDIIAAARFRVEPLNQSSQPGHLSLFSSIHHSQRFRFVSYVSGLIPVSLPFPTTAVDTFFRSSMTQSIMITISCRNDSWIDGEWGEKPPTHAPPYPIPISIPWPALLVNTLCTGFNL